MFDLLGIFEEKEDSAVYGGEEQVFINHSYFEAQKL